MPRGGFPPRVVAAIRDGMIIGIRAGTAPHRIIGIWAVVVEGRVFVRSWSLKPRSWWRTFQEDPLGVIEVGGRRIRVRAVATRSERLKDAVTRAYREKYHSPGSRHYVRGFAQPRRRDTPPRSWCPQGPRQRVANTIFKDSFRNEFRSSRRRRCGGPLEAELVAVWIGGEQLLHAVGRFPWRLSAHPLRDEVGVGGLEVFTAHEETRVGVGGHTCRVWCGRPLTVVVGSIQHHVRIAVA
jgi:hypothetical protein